MGSVVLGLAATTAVAMASAGSAPLSKPTGKPSTVVADIQGFRNDKGKALVALFGSEEGFPNDAGKALRRVEVSIVKGRARAAFKDVPPGTYALAVLHDEDGDRKMKTGAFGIPKEGYGTSRDARGRFGPPDYDDAVITVRPAKILTAHINMIYH